MLKNLAKYKKTLTSAKFVLLFFATNHAQSQINTIVKAQNNTILEVKIKDIIRLGSEINAENTWRKKSFSCSASNLEQDMLYEHNRSRKITQQCGSKKLRPAKSLKLDCGLHKVATRHAKHLKKKSSLSHIGARNAALSKRVSRHSRKWKTLGENIARGDGDTTAIHQAWMNSSQHCKNVMNSKFNSVGIAKSGPIWVVVFAEF